MVKPGTFVVMTITCLCWGSLPIEKCWWPRCYSTVAVQQGQCLTVSGRAFYSCRRIPEKVTRSYSEISRRSVQLGSAETSTAFWNYCTFFSASEEWSISTWDRIAF